MTSRRSLVSRDCCLLACLQHFKGLNVRELCDQLRELATDSKKYIAKKDRRAQRSSFRDILHAVADWESPDQQVRFASETLDVDSWTKKRHYDALCNVVGTGMNTHLQVREAGAWLLTALCR